MRLPTTFLVALAAATAMLTGSASAQDTSTSITRQFTSDHCTGLCGPQTSFATLTATESGDSISFTITPNNGNTIINTGFPLSLGFSLNGISTITYSGLTSGFSVVNPTVAGGLIQNAQTFHMDGFGDFEFGVLFNTQGGGHGTSGPLSFTITAAGLDLTDFALSTQHSGDPANDPAYLALDIISGTTGSPTGNTGLVDLSASLTPTVFSVPGPVAGAGLPALMALFGFYGWRRKRRTA